MRKRTINQLAASLFVFIVLFTIFSVTRVYLFDWFFVSSLSMYPTLTQKDVVIIDKRIFGPRILKRNSISKENEVITICSRKKAKRLINVNDIIVFNFPLNNSLTKVEFNIENIYVKRCVGLPRDSILINNGFIKNKNYLNTIGLPTEQRKLSFLDISQIKTPEIFPTSMKKYRWTIKDYGPILIPGKGLSVILDEKNILLYKLYIEYETQEKVTIHSDNKIFLGHSLLDSYTFTKNYYFVCGDNLSFSFDSRNWGFIPEDFIIGVVSKIIK